MADQTMGQRIAAERKKLSISQEALGEKVGVSRQAISKWEADGAVPEIDKLIALSRLFGVSVGWLLGVEEQPEKQSDELTESQLIMVEEIVRRYKPEPSGRRLLYNLIIVLAGLITIAFVFAWSFPRNTTGKDYSSRIANLEAYYNGIDSQFASLYSRIDDLSSAAEDANSPLTGYQFYLEPNDEEEILTVTVEAVPRTWTGSDAATLYVRQNGAYYTSAAFQWDGRAHMATVEVAYDNGYEYWMTLQTGPGQTETIQLHNTAAQNPKKQYAITCDITDGNWRFDKDARAFKLFDYEVHLCKPYTAAHADIPWEYAEWTLCHIRNGQRDIILTDSNLVSEDDAFTESWCYLDTDLFLPELQEGDTLELWYRAGLADGPSISTPVCSWAYANGGLIQSKPAS